MVIAMIVMLVLLCHVNIFTMLPYIGVVIILCKFNYDLTSSEGPLLSRFWEFFFKNAHSFSFVIVIANLKYSMLVFAILS